MRVLVTGGSGFLGRQIVYSAQRAHYEVLLPRSREMDLMDLQSILRYLQTKPQVDAIIHSAAHYGGIGINVEEPANLFFVNSVMALNVWEAAACKRIPTVVSVGSACAYPGDLKGDFKESDLEAGPCHDSVVGYGMTKRVQLTCQKVYRKQHHINGAHPILTNLYGPNDEYGAYRSHVVAALIAKFCDATETKKDRVVCWGNGAPIREFLYVADAADAIVRSVKFPDAGCINIGTGVGTSIKELVDLLVELTEFKGEVIWDTSKPLGADRKVLDVSKARNVMDWTAPTKLKDGLATTIQWYRSFPEQLRKCFSHGG